MADTDNFKRMNDGSYIVQNTRLDNSSKSPNYFSACNDLARVCKLTGITEERINALKVSSEDKTQIMEIVKDALNFCYDRGCEEVLTHFIQ